MAVPAVKSMKLEADDADLSADQGWELIFQSFGSSKELFAEFGGGEAFLKAERAAWEQDSAA